MKTRTIAAVGALALVVASCGGSTEAGEDSVETTVAITSDPSTTSATTGPTTTTDESTTTEPPPPSTTTTTLLAQPLEDVVGATAANAGGWRVEPGRYVAAFDEWNVTLEIVQPVTYLEGEGRLDFGPEQMVESGVPEWVRLGTFVGVVPPAQAGVHAPHDPVVPTYTADLPDDLGSYLETVPQLVANETDQVEGDGFTARAWNVSVDPAQGETFPCFLGSCVSVLVSEFGGVYVFGSEAAARVWQFEGDGEGVYGYLQSRPDTFEDTVAIAEMLFENLSFGTSE